MRIRIFISMVVMAFGIGACASTFLVNKEGDERVGRFLGSTSNSMYEMLCASGDLLKVLEASHLNKEMKEAFYQPNCSPERSYDKVKQLFASMTSEQRKDIRTAFKKNGYSINGGGC